MGIDLGFEVSTSRLESGVGRLTLRFLPSLPDKELVGKPGDGQTDRKWLSGGY